MRRNKEAFRRGLSTGPATIPNNRRDSSSINSDEQIPWFLKNIVREFPPMERLIDYIIDRLQDTERFKLAKQLELCKSNQDASSMRFFGFDLYERDLDELFNELPERINPGRLGSHIDDMYLTVLPSCSYRTFMTNMIPMAFGIGGDKLRIHTKVRKLGKMLNLSSDEMVYITFAYCMAHDDDFSRLCNWEESARTIRDAALMLGTSTSTLRKMISDRSPLIRYGIIDRDAGRSMLKLNLDDSVDDYLSGYSDTPYSADVQPVAQSRFPLESFPVTTEETSLLLDLLQADECHHILVFGVPGTGKTEYMKALVKHSGRDAQLLRFNESMKGRQGRIVSLSTVSRMLAPSRAILIIDECDSILNTEQSFSFMSINASSSEQFGKEWLNLFLDEAKLTTVWITNNTTGIHESVKRRFDASIFFEATPLEHRKRIWLALAREYDLYDFAVDQRAFRLIHAYLPSPANMESALKLLKKAGDQDQDQYARLELTLCAQRTLKQGSVSKPKLEDLVELYDPDSVNASVTPAELLESINLAYAHQENICLLFHGSPGTGKTELAKYLSKECGRSLLVKRSSDLLNPFIGMTEIMIARMFREAERDGSILLLDEADSLLRNRSSAHRSWEITQTNELLTQMENFKGVMIACTNLIDVMDKAVLRRFAWKVHFSPLNKEQRLRLFGTWFPLAMLNEQGITVLSGISVLSPGDFKAVAKRLHPGKMAQSSYILAQLQVEASYRDGETGPRQRIGFGA